MRKALEQRLAIFPADGKRIERILPTKKAAAQVSKAPDDKHTESASINSTSNNSDSTNDTAAISESNTETTIATTTAETLVNATYYQPNLRSNATFRTNPESRGQSY